MALFVARRSTLFCKHVGIRLNSRSLQVITRGFSNHDPALKDLKNDFKPLTQNGKGHYLWDRREANLIVEKFTNVQDSFVFEMSPGPALLSQAFLRAGCPKVFCVEPNPFFTDSLKELEREYPNRFFPHVDMSSQFWHPVLIDGVFPRQELESNRTEWDSEKIFARIISLRALKNNQDLVPLLLDIHFQHGLFSFGRCEAVFMMTNQHADKFLRPQHLCASLVTLKMIFDVKAVHCLQNTAFFPTTKRKKTNYTLLSFTPKRNTGIRVKDNDIQSVYSLMKVLYHRRSQPLSSHFQTLVQDTDAFLEKVGLSKDLKPKDLTKEERLLIINEYFEWKDRNQFVLSGGNFYPKECHGLTRQ